MLLSPVEIGAVVVGYLACGIVWSQFKWMTYCRREALRRAEMPPMAQNQKALIYGWTLGWPFSVVLTVITPSPRIGGDEQHMDVPYGQETCDHERSALDREIDEGERNRW